MAKFNNKKIPAACRSGPLQLGARASGPFGPWLRRHCREFQRTDAREEQDEEYEGKSSSARDLFLAAVNAKLEDGNIRAATRILCSQDHPVKATPVTFAAMQENTHLTNGRPN